MPDTDDELPEAYKRLIAAQRVVTPEERDKIERRARDESRTASIQRRMPKVY